MDGPFGVKQHRKPAINITPLIDVMFLLLIFFMVSSTFREHLGIDVALPRAGTGAALEERSEHEVSVRATDEIYIGQILVTTDELRETLRALVTEDPDAQITLRADENAKFQRVLSVIDIARDVGATNLILPTRPLESTPQAPQ